ncbi:MAG: primosomal protein N' [Bacteroidota bacterium]|nr:primosomal protein N' [Bacteroidota bacterium]
MAKYAEIVFPLPFRNSFTYIIPEELEHLAIAGVRAVVPFGKRTVTGFIINISDTTDVTEGLKSVQEILDKNRIFNNEMLNFYKWVADYYLSSLGETIRLSIPYGIEVESQRRITADKEYCKELLANEKRQDTVKFRILEFLSEKDNVTLNSIQKVVNKKNIYHTIKKMNEEGILTIHDDIIDPKVKVKKTRFVRLKKTASEIYEQIPEIETKSPVQLKILLELLKKKNKPVQASKLIAKTEASSASLNGLVKKDLVEIFEKEIERKYIEHYTEEIKLFELTEDQNKIVAEVSQNLNKFQTYLLHGVTGSGKTQVYIELIKKVLEEGKTAIFLVPEISLTPQATARLLNNFPGTVAVMHSRISLGERYDAWRKIVDGKVNVVIGARSAIFAPLKNIGIIIVDEEHDQSYKQFDMTPKYNGRDTAIILAKYNNCPVMLGSATPSIESMYNAKTGKYTLLQLPQRIDDAKMPVIELVNTSYDMGKKKGDFIFSSNLLNRIDDKLKKEEGVIILQNRRGFSTQVYCNDCGQVIICDNCSVPMVYHINKNNISCHYCGLVKTLPDHCGFCGSYSLKYFGMGTEKVEDELGYYFPNANIQRIDSDSISKKASLSNILQSFSKGEIDILVGTQIVSKGLDFSRVTLVGVISAENNLWMPDFRADERTFQLLTQVAGRAGRSKNEGEVLIQTLNPQNFVLQRVLEYDYQGLYENQILQREQMGFPPFTRLCLIEARDLQEDKAKGAINDFYKNILAYKKYVTISEPAPALIARLKSYYRFHLLVKSNKSEDKTGSWLRKAIMDSYIKFKKESKHKDIRLVYDIDPQSMM